MRNCSKPVNAAKSTMRRLDYYGKKADQNSVSVHQVLADLCQQLDGGLDGQQDTQETDDSTIFKALLSSSNEDQEGGDGTTEVVTINEVLILTSDSDESTDPLEGLDNSSHDEFLGACIDSAAQKTVIGVRQARALCAWPNEDFKIEDTWPQTTFSFGTHRHRSMGQVEVKIPACRIANVKLKLSGVESHNAIGVGERYHHHLRHVYNKVCKDHAAMCKEDKLTIAVKALNDTVGPHGLGPTLLVFGIMPRIPFVHVNLPDQIERMKAMTEARKEMGKRMAATLLKKAMKMNAPAAATRNIQIGSEVLVYKEKPIRKWLGPHLVLDVQGKAVFVDTKGNTVQLSVDKVKPYLRPSEDEEVHEDPIRDDGSVGGDDTPVNTPPAIESAQPGSSRRSMASLQRPVQANSDIVADLRSVMEGLRNDDQIRAPTPALEAASETQLRQHDSISAREFTSVVEVNLTETLSPQDPRGTSPIFQEAKKREVEGLENRSVWRVIPKSDLPEKPNIVGGKFVLTMKNLGTNKEKAKARYVGLGHLDKDKPHMVHNTTTLRQSLCPSISFGCC